MLRKPWTVGIMHRSQPRNPYSGKFLFLESVFWVLTWPCLGRKGYQRANIWGRWELSIDVRVGLPNSCHGNSWNWPGWEEKGEAVGERCQRSKSAMDLQGLCGFFQICIWTSRLLRRMFVKVGRHILLNSLSTCFTAFNCLNVCYMRLQLYFCTGSQLLGIGLLFKKTYFQEDF